MTQFGVELFRGRKPLPPADELVGIEEIAAMLGVSRRRARELGVRADFPLPLARIPSRRVWLKKDVESWERDTGQH